MSGFGQNGHGLEQYGRIPPSYSNPYAGILDMNLQDIQNMYLQQRQMQRIFNSVPLTGQFQGPHQLIQQNQVRNEQPNFGQYQPEQNPIFGPQIPNHAIEPLQYEHHSPAQIQIEQPELQPAWSDLVLVFIIFVIAFAIIRNLFGRVWTFEIKNENIRNQLKRRGGSKSPPAATNQHQTFDPSDNEDHGPYAQIGEAAQENENLTFVEKAQNIFKSKFDPKSDEAQQKTFQMVHLNGSPNKDVFTEESASANTTSDSSNSAASGLVSLAANLVGVGKGSTYNPIKAAVVEDDEEVESEGSDLETFDQFNQRIKEEQKEDDKQIVQAVIIEAASPAIEDPHDITGIMTEAVIEQIMDSDFDRKLMMMDEDDQYL